MEDGTRTKAEIEAELEAARQRLADGLASLITQVHPRAIVHRAASDVRGVASDQVRAFRAQLVNPDGSLNVTRAALVGAAVAGGLAFLAVVRSIVRR